MSACAYMAYSEPPTSVSAHNSASGALGADT